MKCMSGGNSIQYKNTKGDYSKASLVFQQLHNLAKVEMAVGGFDMVILSMVPARV